MRASALSLALLLVACGAPATSSEPQPRPQSALAWRITSDNERLDRELAADGVFAADIGETVDLGGGLTITPLAIVDDSRCPNDVVCETAGRILVRANVSGEEMEFEQMRLVETPRGSFTLAVVKPGSWLDWPENEVPRPPHRFGFRRS